jgi:hypothetical protein
LGKKYEKADEKKEETVKEKGKKTEEKGEIKVNTVWFELIRLSNKVEQISVKMKHFCDQANIT